ncbi:MAG: PSD1 and planctomycete cytochrome C domain-containing protein [Bryobacteraceae bacterium]
MLREIFVAFAFSISQLGAQSTFFESTIKPILQINCIGCHSEKNLTSGFSLESKESIQRGGNRGSSSQILLDAIRQTGDLKMPPGRRLSAEQIAALEKWVADGLPMASGPAKAKRPATNHWSFQPPLKASLPQLPNASWVRTPIDAFILARLETVRLKPSAEADRATLIRRVSLDLTGLPPTKEEFQTFLTDRRSDAYEKLVDRLLDSPHYGERWGRHWLDVARYADSDGYTIDAPRDIWRYRDWVIRALNDDKPFDQFTIEQFAGDLLPQPTTDQLIATGFHRNTPSNFEGGIDFEQYRVEAVVDRVATTGAAYLGLTLGCARCHDHKYDPVSQREFYQFFSFFNNTEEIDKEADRKHFNRPFLELPTPDDLAKQAEYDSKLKAMETDLAAYELSGTFDDELCLADRRAQVEAFKRRAPKPSSTLVMREKPEARPAYIHLGGDFTRKGISVQPAVPAVLPQLPAEAKQPNRLDLAKWLVDRRNPLTARVTVNRVWQQYFGRGLVETENDFGTQGDKPTHPELLDWLAVDFMEKGWSQKALHRQIVTSAVYRQESSHRPDAAPSDPDNRLLWRQNRLRLDAEIVRDSSLLSSGKLSRKVGGPSVFPPQPEGVYQVTQVRREWKTSEERPLPSRTVHFLSTLGAPSEPGRIRRA